MRNIILTLPLTYRSRLNLDPSHPSIFALLRSRQSLGWYDLLPPPYATPYSNATHLVFNEHNVLHSSTFLFSYVSKLLPYTQLWGTRMYEMSPKIITKRCSEHICKKNSNHLVIIYNIDWITIITFHRLARIMNAYYEDINEIAKKLHCTNDLGIARLSSVD